MDTQQPSKTNWFVKTAGVRGEFWYANGQLIEADSNTGDGHAEVAIEDATNDLLDLLRIPGDHQGGLHNYTKYIARKLQWNTTFDNEGFMLKLIDALVMAGVQHDNAQEMVLTAAGNGDPRRWLLNKGYILIRNHDFAIATINTEIVREMYRAAQLVMGDTEQGDDVQEESDHFINIGVQDTGQYYMGVPLETLANGNPYYLEA